MPRRVQPPDATHSGPSTTQAAAPPPHRRALPQVHVELQASTTQAAAPPPPLPTGRGRPCWASRAAPQDYGVVVDRRERAAASTHRLPAARNDPPDPAGDRRGGRGGLGCAILGTGRTGRRSGGNRSVVRGRGGLGGPLARLAAPPAVAALQNGIERIVVDQRAAGLGGWNGGRVGGGGWRGGGRRQRAPFARGPAPRVCGRALGLAAAPFGRGRGRGRRARGAGVDNGRRRIWGGRGHGPRNSPLRAGPRTEHSAYPAILAAQRRLLVGQPRGDPVQVRPVRVVQRPAGLDHSAYVQQARRLAYPRLGHLAHIVCGVLGAHARHAGRLDILLPPVARAASRAASAPVLSQVAEQYVVGELVDAGAAPLGEAVELCRIVPS